MRHEVILPHADGTRAAYVLGEPSPFPTAWAPSRSRTAYAAAHVVADPLADNSPAAPAHLDWDATLAYRRYLWSLGFAVAEAMDTAQRGMGLDWPATQELIRRSVAEARAVGGIVACGAGADQLSPSERPTLRDVQHAYEEQCAFVEQLSGRIVLMASRALAACARTADDYLRVYDAILSQVAGPVILHWLGEAFDPALAGYWGSRDPDAAMSVCLQIVQRHVAKIDGVKVSLLEPAYEVALRRQLPPGVRLYTGDDFHYAELILGDEQGYSHALLGIFDAIAPAAASALAALDAGDQERYLSILAPTIPLSRHIFSRPTFYYKTGLVFLAYLNGRQSHFRMVAGLESARSIVHLAELFILADQAHLLVDPELATQRMRRVLAVAGIE
jgi:hypothetical protein